MKLRTKLFLKTLAILTPIELLWFIVSMIVAFYVNDFLGRSLAGIGFIIIPLFGSYYFMLKELDNDEEMRFKKFLKQQETKKKVK